jgi:hypothetical protein
LSTKEIKKRSLLAPQFALRVAQTHKNGVSSRHTVFSINSSKKHY